MNIPLAVAGERPLASLDESGYLHFDGGWRLEWWVGGDDHWHVPAASTSRRQRVLAHTPVVETAIRVPGGDVAWRAAAAATGDGGAVVCEFANTAAIPVALGIALIAPDAIDDPQRRPALHFTTPARSVAADFGIELLVHPVSHGTTWRASIGAAAPDMLPDLDAVVRGWQTLVRQGASVATEDEGVDGALATARAALLLHAGGYGALGRKADNQAAALVATALTLVGAEDQAEALRLAVRLKPKRRGLPTVTDIEPALTTDAFSLLADPTAAAATVAAVRAQLVDDSKRRTLDLLPSADASWRGRSVDVTNLPTNCGPVSFALRWHGDKPALLWELAQQPRRQRISLRAPAIDPAWSSTEPSGEELLAVRARQ